MSAAWQRFRQWLDDAQWSKNPRLGLFLILASAMVTIVLGALGPSTVVLNVGPAPGLLPPWFVPVEVGAEWGLPLSQWFLVPLLWLGLTAGAAGLWIASRAIGYGWRPKVRRLFVLGVGVNMLTALVPPFSSADVLMYAAYGRLQAQGMDPYEITPAMVFRQSFDPVLAYTERPWQDTPSVYGPIASGSQWLANVLGGDSMHDVVFWLQMFAVIPFIVICAVLIKMAHGNAARQARAVLFTILNPLLIWNVVAGAHNEALTLVFAIVALFFVRKNAFVTGIWIGLAGCTKVSLVFYGLALVWGYRRDWRKVLQLGVGALIPIAIGYGIFAPEALFAAGRNTGYISGGAWAPVLLAILKVVLPDSLARSIVGVSGWVFMIVLGWMLSRVLPWSAVPGAEVAARRDPLTIAVRTSLVISAAWVLSSPYSLAWYDILAWAPLALILPNRLDRVFIWRGWALSLGYVTGRSVMFSDAMMAATFVIRDVFTSGLACFLIFYVIRWWWVHSKELPTRAFIRRGLREIDPRKRPVPRPITVVQRGSLTRASGPALNSDEAEH